MAASLQKNWTIQFVLANACHVTQPKLFWLKYNCEYRRVDPRKRSLTHYLFMAAVHNEILKRPREPLRDIFPRRIRPPSK